MGGAFGSYGWGGQSLKHLERLLQEMKVELVGDGVGARYVPDDDALGRCHSLGMQVASSLEGRVGKEGGP